MAPTGTARRMARRGGALPRRLLGHGPTPCAVGIPNQRSLMFVRSGNSTGDNAGSVIRIFICVY